MKIMIPISVGELMDRVSILFIKKRMIKDPGKLIHVQHELDQLEKVSIPFRDKYYERLELVNANLWSIEDKIRDCEKKKDFSDFFIRLARFVYQLNDERSEIKRKINEKYSSEIIEVKSYNK